LTFALWDLACFPEFRKKVADEIAKFFPSRDDMTAVTLGDLPFLNAFLLESMRFHGIIIGWNVRMSPKEGAIIHGKFIPEGVW
jgi:cytochrome P450